MKASAYHVNLRGNDWKDWFAQLLVANTAYTSIAFVLVHSSRTFPRKESPGVLLDYHVSPPSTVEKSEKTSQAFFPYGFINKLNAASIYLRIVYEPENTTSLHTFKFLILGILQSLEIATFLGKLFPSFYEAT